MSEEIFAGRPCPDMLAYLHKRRSVSVKHLSAPGPDAAQLEAILKAASRVPDHGKQFPWYFIVFDGDARVQAGAALEKAWRATHPDEAPAKLELEAERFTRAPLVIAVVSKIRQGKRPVWEQILSAGAACQNLCLAANALGFATNWLTEWYSCDDTFRSEIGLGANEHFAGFIYIGTAAQMPEERDRPDLAQIVTYWQPDAALNKGDDYGSPGKGWPEAGFCYQPDE